MHRNLSSIESPLAVCVRASGTLPISTQGHYDHWLKYHGRRCTLNEDGITKHLKKIRVQRSLTKIMKSHKQLRLPSLRSGISRKTSSLQIRGIDDVFDLYDKAVDSGSNCWTGSPLPDIVKSDVEAIGQTDPVQQPFLDSAIVEMRVTSLTNPIRSINEQDLLRLFPPRSLHIYVASSNSDMTIERAHLESTVWPQLRHLCLEYNRELVIHDLHTFYGELITFGRKNYLNEINRSLRLCLDQSSGHIKAVILFGDYFDEKGPPELLTVKEISIIKSNMQKDIEEIKRLQGQINDLKIHQQQMKHSEIKESSNINSFNNGEHSKSDLKKVLHLNIGNDTINAEISALGQTIDNINYKTNITILEQWYRQSSDNNENYFLQSERDLIKELKSTDSNQLKQGKVQWNNIKEQLCYIISSYAENIMNQQKTIFQYELDSLDKLMTDSQCLLIARTFNNIRTNEEVKLSKSKVIAKVKEINQIRFEIRANKDRQLSQNDDWEHVAYLKHLSSNVYRMLEQNLIETLRVQDRHFKDKIHHFCVTEISEKDLLLLFSELEFQFKMINSKFLCDGDLFTEIEDVVSKIEDLIASCDGITVVLTGSEMTGKSRAMSTFIKRKEENILRHNSIFIYRIISSSFHSATMVGLLRSICLQIIYQTGISMNVPQELMALKTLFYQLTLMINFPVIICIDGLDLLTDLSPDSSANFDWLPIHNKHFSLIMSCIEDTQAYKYLDSYISSVNKVCCIINVSELRDTTIDNLIKSYVINEKPSWTIEQEETIKKQCFLNKSIGFVQSTLRIAKYWTTSSSLPRLGTKMDQNLFIFFGKLEDIYGEPIIRRLLGYLTCFKDGCSLNELTDLMTFDDVVQKFLDATFNRKNFRYTFSLLRCAFLALEDITVNFLDQSGIETIKWRNQVYFKTATERYLLQKDKAASYHQVVSQYFLNNSADQLIVTKIVDDGTKRPVYSDFLIKQELLYTAKFDRSINKFNRRKLLQLPYHLILSQNNKLAKSICFFNFYWIQAILINFDYYHALRDIVLAYQTEHEDLEFPVLLSSLELCKGVLLQDPYQLISQVLGRLTNTVRQDIDSIEPQKFPYLEAFLKSLRSNNWFTSIIPSKSCMTAHDKMEYTSIGFHFGKVTCILLHKSGTKVLASTSNGVLYIWDAGRNQMISIINEVGRNIFQMLLGNLETTLITAMPESIDLWDLESKKILKTIAMFYDMYRLTISADSTIFSSLFFGIFWMASWNIKTTELILSKQLPVTTSTNCDGEIVTVDVCKDFLTLAAVKYDNKAIIIDIRNGEINPKVLKCKVDGSAVTNVAKSARYYVLCNRGLSETDYVSMIFYLDLFDEEKLQLVRRIVGCSLDMVISLSINSVGSHAITVNSNKNMNISDVSVWNLETQEHKHCSEIPCIVTSVQCVDLARIILLNSESNVLLKTNILTSKVKISERRQNYLLKRYLLNDMYTFVCSIDNSEIEIYNMVRDKYRGKRVHTIAGIAGANDIILPYKDKLVILSERGYSSIVPDCKEVFQLIKIYDLTQSRVIQETKNVFIYPSRKTEFVILEHDILVGLSDSRSHLVYWNLSTGHIQRRLKPKLDDVTEHKDASVLSLEHGIRHDVIDTILLSGDESIVVAAYFQRFLSVFSLTEACHQVNLIGDGCLLHLQTAAITFDGKFLVQNNYNETLSCAYLTMWNTRTGAVENSLSVTKNILSVAISRDAKLVCFIKENVGCFVWHTNEKKQSSFFELSGSANRWSAEYGLTYSMEFIRNDEILFICNEKGFHFWNVSLCNFDFIGSFQPDYRIQSFTMCCNDSLLAFLLRGSNEMYTLRLTNSNDKKIIVSYNYLKYFEKDKSEKSDLEEDQEY